MLIGTEYKFLLFPRRCKLSDKLLWFCYAYVEIHCFTGPGDSIFEYNYYDKNEYLVNKLKGTV
jgi:hypothetical protein